MSKMNRVWQEYNDVVEWCAHNWTPETIGDVLPRLSAHCAQLIAADAQAFLDRVAAEARALQPPYRSSGRHTGDWMKLHCGDRVKEKEGRHYGRVEQIRQSTFVVVRWENTGWLSECRLNDLERVNVIAGPRSWQNTKSKEK